MTPAPPERGEAERVHEHRVRALLVSFRQLRHDLASPLSGAALHLEMASRRLAQRADPELERLAENVRISQQEVAWASGVLDLVGELARSADDPLERFPLERALRTGVERQAARAARDGVRLEVAGRAPGVELFGARERLEQAVSELTAHALAREGRGGAVTWTLAAGAAGAEASVSWRAEPDEHPERAFALTRRRPGDPPGVALFLARWAVEGLGGRLKIEAETGRHRARALFGEGVREEAR